MMKQLVERFVTFTPQVHSECGDRLHRVMCMCVATFIASIVIEVRLYSMPVGVKVTAFDRVFDGAPTVSTTAGIEAVFDKTKERGKQSYQTQRGPPILNSTAYNRLAIPKRIVYSNRHNNNRFISTWRQLNSDHEFQYYSNAAVEDLVKEHRPDLYALFPNMSMVERIDVFRYAALDKIGGVYTDVDVQCVQPVSKWHEPWADDIKAMGAIQRFDFVIGLEFIHPQIAQNPLGHNTSLQLVQWTFASRAHSPLLDHVMDNVAHAVMTVPRMNGDEDAVLERTGPKVFTSAVLEFFGKHGSPSGVNESWYNHPNVLNTGELMDRGGGQLIRLNGTHKGNEFAMAGVILPKRAFGYHRLHKKGYKPAEDHLIVHNFAGSWRAAPRSVTRRQGTKHVAG